MEWFGCFLTQKIDFECQDFMIFDTTVPSQSYRYQKNYFETSDLFAKMKFVSTACVYTSLCKSGYSRMVMTLLNIKSPFVLENGHSVKKKINVKKLMLSLVQTETRYVNWFISVLCSQKITDFWEEYRNMKERHIF